jgi:hypothetical protein
MTRRDRRPASCADLIDDSLRYAGVRPATRHIATKVIDHDRRSSLSEVECEQTTDAAPRASYDYNLSFEVDHRVPFIRCFPSLSVSLLAEAVTHRAGIESVDNDVGHHLLHLDRRATPFSIKHKFVSNDFVKPIERRTRLPPVMQRRRITMA